MSSHANIAIKINNKKEDVKLIYCHFNGELSGVGKILNESYSDIEKVERLIELGDIEQLGRKLEPDSNITKVSKYKKNDVTISYRRDRHELFNIPRNSTISRLEEETPSYFYLYMFDGEKWLYYNLSIKEENKWVPLSAVL